MDQLVTGVLIGALACYECSDWLDLLDAVVESGCRLYADDIIHAEIWLLHFGKIMDEIIGMGS